MAASELNRKMPIGAELVGEDGGEGVHFRVWAPRRARIEVVLEGGAGAGDRVLLERDANDYHAGVARNARAGTLYRFRVDDSNDLFPDPASRFQPEGPHGPSQVVDPDAFSWQASEGWMKRDDHVIYEMHVGAFTAEGTYAAASRELPELADLGVTVIELMPIADFPGRFGWGYDGVNLFAPTHLYGKPDDLRAFVDRAHSLGIGVILDVVYNHLGPDGNFLAQFSTEYVTNRYKTEWGDPINFHGEGSGPVREFYVANAAYWIREYRMDGLRLDATQNIYDVGEGASHILADIARATRAAGGDRPVYLVAENESQDTTIVRPQSEDGYGLDAIWNDDFHHSAMVALTGRKEAYYMDYLGTPQEFISAVKWGFLYQGQHYVWQDKRRGTSALDLPPRAFIHYLQNHDQIANSARGERVHRLTSPGRLRAMTALLLLSPSTPLLFMGQEFAASSPFLFFADHNAELAEQVFAGRREFLSQFASLAQKEAQDVVDAPSDIQTFKRSKLNLGEREENRGIYQLHRDLLRIRRENPAIGNTNACGIDGAVLSSDAFVIRYFGKNDDDMLLVVNLGHDLVYSPAPEPLLAPPRERRWALTWSSEDPAYDGNGTPEPEDKKGIWRFPGEAALLLRAESE